MLHIQNFTFLITLMLSTGFITFQVMAQNAPPAIPMAPAMQAPAGLVVSDDPLPKDLDASVYSGPVRTRAITPEEVLSKGYFQDGSDTVVGRKVSGLRSDVFSLQGVITELSERLASLENKNQKLAAEYYANIATISTQLQSGTTPGNPRLLQRLTSSRSLLETLSGNIAELNALSIEVNNAASMSAFLLESTRAAYSLTGAVEEDHIMLAKIEDSISNLVVVVERLSSNINDDIVRTTAYLNTERENLRTMNLAVATGNFFGQALSTASFSQTVAKSAPGITPALMTPPLATPLATPLTGAPIPAELGTAAPFVPNFGLGALPQKQQLVKIRFTDPSVSYQQPVYMAVNEALSRYPNARFEVVAVHPSSDNVAKTAIESTKARRNAERVLKTMNEIGLPLDRVDLTYSASPATDVNEVHIFIL